MTCHTRVPSSGNGVRGGREVGQTTAERKRCINKWKYSKATDATYRSISYISYVPPSLPRGDTRS